MDDIPITVIELVQKLKPKFARMSFDQVDDMQTEDLMVHESLLKLYAPIFVLYPGLKYVKELVQVQLLRNIRI